MKSTIVKGWDKIGITKTFGTELQLSTSDANTITLLFTIIQSIEKQMEENINANPTLLISIIMEESLQDNFVSIQSSICPNTSRSQLRKLVRKQKIIRRIVVSKLLTITILLKTMW